LKTHLFRISYVLWQIGEFLSVYLETQERTPVGKKFYVRGPATQKALSLRRRLVRGRLKLPRELERKRVSEQRLQSVQWGRLVPCRVERQTSRYSLYWMRLSIGNQCSCFSSGRAWARAAAPQTNLTAASCTRWRRWKVSCVRSMFHVVL